jgi:hypothetical protein
MLAACLKLKEHLPLEGRFSVNRIALMRLQGV